MECKRMKMPRGAAGVFGGSGEVLTVRAEMAFPSARPAKRAEAVPLTQPMSAMEVAPNSAINSYSLAQFGFAHCVGVDPNDIGRACSSCLRSSSLLVVDGEGVLALLQLLGQNLRDGGVVEGVGASGFREDQHDLALDVAKGGQRTLSLAFIASFMSALMRS